MAMEDSFEIGLRWVRPAYENLNANIIYPVFVQINIVRNLFAIAINEKMVY